MTVAAKTATLTSTTCAYCGVGCGIDIEHKKDPLTAKVTLESLAGMPEHPANFGRLCVKGSKLLETNALSGRLLHPEIRGQQVSWPEAIEEVASGFSRIIEEHGPDAVALYVSGQLLTEDYYVANKLMKGYIGSANIDTNSRLCMSSAVASYKRAFGEDAVPTCYDDLEHSDLMVLVGSNAAWTHPVLFQRMERAKKRNPQMRFVFVDPRRTASCELADLHLAIKPGTDVALFNGLLNYQAAHFGLDEDYIAQHTEGFEQSLAQARAWSIEKVASYCDVDSSDVREFFQWFTSSDKVISFYSMGVNQSSSGVDKGNAIINCHLASGKIGKVGSGPFSITGQPNAMGGREVGGLANMLAAHMDIDNPLHRQWVKDYWQSPLMADKPGLKAVELFDAIEQGKVKAVWVMATNPLVSMPNRNKIEAALEKCELVVVSDCVERNDTLGFAHVKLPATGWSEKNGTVTNSERCISRQRGILPAPGEARHDWKIICDVARAMGFGDGFSYDHPCQIFSEHAGLSGVHNQGTRAFDISAFAELSQREYDNWTPVQWPVNEAHPNGSKRLFTNGRFSTANGRAKFIAVVPKAPEQLTSDAYPFVLNTGRLRDQWHTMTRTGKAASLSQHIPTSFVAMTSADAKAADIEEGQLVHLYSALSGDKAVTLPVSFDDGLRPNSLFAPIHWGETHASASSVARLFSDARDPLSGQPELKHAAVKVEKASFAHVGQVFLRDDICLDFSEGAPGYWMKARLDGAMRYQIASNDTLEQTKAWLRSQFDTQWEWLGRQSAQSQTLIALADGQLQAYLLLGVTPAELPDEWLVSLFADQHLQPTQLAALLRQTPDEAFLNGKLVCSCFQVREKPIRDAISSGCDSVESLGRKLKCGTNCGSCKTELSQMLRQPFTAQIPVAQIDNLVTLEVSK